MHITWININTFSFVTSVGQSYHAVIKCQSSNQLFWWEIISMLIELTDDDYDNDDSYNNEIMKVILRSSSVIMWLVCTF